MINEIMSSVVRKLQKQHDELIRDTLISFFGVKDLHALKDHPNITIEYNPISTKLFYYDILLLEVFKPTMVTYGTEMTLMYKSSIGTIYE